MFWWATAQLRRNQKERTCARRDTTCTTNSVRQNISFGEDQTSES